MDLFEWAPVAAVAFHLILATLARRRRDRVGQVGHSVLAAGWTVAGLYVWAT